MMQDAFEGSSEVKPVITEPTVKPNEPQEEKRGEFLKVTIGEVDDLLEKTASRGIPEEDRQQKIKKFLQTVSPEDAKRLEDVNTRRAKELDELQPPEFKVTEEHLEYPGSFGAVKRAAQRELPQLEEALDRSQKWKQRWDSLTWEEKRQKTGRILELIGGTHTGRYIDEKGRPYSPEDARRAGINNYIGNTEDRLKSHIEKLRLAVKTKSTPIVLREMQAQKVQDVRKYLEETPHEQTPPQEQPPTPPQPAPKGGLFGRIFGKKL